MKTPILQRMEDLHTGLLVLFVFTRLLEGVATN